MLQYRLYGGDPIPSGLQGFLKASANIGSVVGQFSFGYAADYFGRKAICKCSCDPPLGALSLIRPSIFSTDGKELMLIIFATIFCIADPTGVYSLNSARPPIHSRITND